MRRQEKRDSDPGLRTERSAAPPALLKQEKNKREPWDLDVSVKSLHHYALERQEG